LTFSALTSSASAFAAGIGAVDSTRRAARAVRTDSRRSREPALELPAYRFDASAYDTEIARAETDCSWSWRARTIARLIKAGLINNQTANRTTRASNHWIGEAMRGQTATLERLRVDRQLEEAMTQGLDPLHLAEVFGLDEKTAMRYADSARQLLLAPPLAELSEEPNRVQ
jgi:hypothetical protein